MNTNGYDILNDKHFSLLANDGGQCGSTWEEMKNWRFCIYGNFGEKDHCYICLLRSERCNSFSEHLDLALTPNKINEGAKKQWNTY